MLGHWGEMLVPFVERAKVLATPAHLDRSVMECVTTNVLVTAGGIYSHRMLRDAVATVGIDRVLFASDDAFGGNLRRLQHGSSWRPPPSVSRTRPSSPRATRNGTSSGRPPASMPTRHHPRTTDG